MTYWVISFIFSNLDEAVKPALLGLIYLFGLESYVELTWVNIISPLVSVVAVGVFIYVLGLVGGNVLGRQLLKGVDKLLLQIPVVRGIYSATKQFLDTFSSEKRAFSRVVLCSFPHKDSYTVGLVSNENTAESSQKSGKDLLAVFVPTSPNPTSGWLLLIPKNDVIALDMSVDDAFKMVISGGVLIPPYPD